MVSYWEKPYHKSSVTIRLETQLAIRRKHMAARRNNQHIALERISILFRNAIEAFEQDRGLAQNYVDLAWKIGMRYKVRRPVAYRRMTCKKCKAFILPGVNCTVRTRTSREPHIVFTCLNCGGHMRIPLRTGEKDVDRAETKTETEKRDG